jgi:AmmeMemoRadiSam system protein A
MKELLTLVQKEKILEIARKTLIQKIKENKIYHPKVKGDKLKKELGVFVTLRKGKGLRGCIGSIVAREPFYLGVRDMVIAASTQDPRFPPVIEAELDDIDIEISVLSPLEKIDNPDKIILGKHGVLVKKGFRSGVFLPQVADETGWSKNEFMSNLCVYKAGLESTCWKTGNCDIFVFSAEVFSE